MAPQTGTSSYTMTGRVRERGRRPAASGNVGKLNEELHEKMSRVVKRGKMWHAVWTDAAGKRRSKSISTRKKDAELFLARISEQDLKARLGGYEPVPFSQVAKEFIEVSGPLRYKPSTLLSYENMLNSRLIPRFGDMIVGEISSRDVEKYLADRTREGSSAASVHNDLTVLGAVLSQASRWGYSSGVATKGVKAPKYKPDRGRALSAEEVRRLLGALPEPWVPLFATMALTGVRSGEAAALTVRDIDFENHLVCVRRGSWKGQLQTPKTPTSVRDIDLGPTLEKILEGWLSSPMRPATKEQLVFPSRGGKLLNMDWVRVNVFYPALEAAGLPRVRLHDLRHTYATMLISQGESLKYVQEMLGHASISVTADVYGHLLRETHASAASKLDIAIFGAPDD